MKGQELLEAIGEVKLPREVAVSRIRSCAVQRRHLLNQTAQSIAAFCLIFAPRMHATIVITEKIDLRIAISRK